MNIQQGSFVAAQSSMRKRCKNLNYPGTLPRAMLTSCMRAAADLVAAHVDEQGDHAGDGYALAGGVVCRQGKEAGTLRGGSLKMRSKRSKAVRADQPLCATPHKRPADCRSDQTTRACAFIQVSDLVNGRYAGIDYHIPMVQYFQDGKHEELTRSGPI
jgi:hypothetical protein